MKTKIILTVAFIGVFAAGYVLGQLFAHTSLDVVSDAEETENNAPVSSSETSVGAAAEESVTIDTSALPDSQRKLLETLGMDTDSITVTPEMVACAEAKLGVARMDEIINGATPTFTEGLKLAACYTIN